VLDEGAAPAARNQALIDAPPAATAQPPVVPPGVAGTGTAVAAAVEAQQAKAAPDAAEKAPAAGSSAPPPPAPAPEAKPAAPAGTATPDTATTTAAGADDLTRIKGVGRKLDELLRSLGVTGLAQIAAWDDAEIDRVDAQLGRFQGRIRRDNWVEQARLLSAGDMRGYEDKFGKL
jgi:predicted flap endonuclease-1-like 5' DNA nuclease